MKCQGQPVIVGVVNQTIARCDQCNGWFGITKRGKWSGGAAKHKDAKK